MRVFDEELSRASEDLASTLQALLREPTHNDSIRIRVSHLACGLSLEHSVAARQLLVHALIPSALVVLRAQYEALVRAVWTLYAATDTQIEKLAAALDVDSDQAAKNLPQVRDMIVS